MLDLEDLKARRREISEANAEAGFYGWIGLDDVDALIAEVERLREENLKRS